mmetsp:Transcript_5508/g.34054  ORF Transcript_5508/g.34054 Transcript_5508/m.34054 type:complete len:133 (+) Transcript_5508:1126-1524(+)
MTHVRLTSWEAFPLKSEDPTLQPTQPWIHPTQAKSRKGKVQKRKMHGKQHRAKLPPSKENEQKHAAALPTRNSGSLLCAVGRFLAIQSPTLQVLLQILTGYLFQEAYNLFRGVLHLAVAVFQQLSQKGKSLW